MSTDVSAVQDDDVGDLVDVTGLDLADLALFHGPRWAAARRAILAWVDTPGAGACVFDHPPPPPTTSPPVCHRARGWEADDRAGAL